MRDPIILYILVKTVLEFLRFIILRDCEFLAKRERVHVVLFQFYIFDTYFLRTRPTSKVCGGFFLVYPIGFNWFFNAFS